MRTRPAAHLASADYINRYNRALQLMRNLPATDPRNFLQQSYVHCAYCNGAYFYPALQGLIEGDSGSCPYAMDAPAMYSNNRTYPALYNDRRNQLIYRRPVNLGTGTDSNRLKHR
ncbi:Polyphenol oxidase, chloroplastic [Sesamum angolense]|uniref:Polyphenol oxidase, chloroplastic n=1 Tax=Sesamum angolense TaxID=2727404 RepID=A0AAE1W5L4_9LAMI|nr:Polyphenol oxidase, chloroplastic [Sesamum angolense]